MTERELIIGKEVIKYWIRQNKRAKRLSLTIYPDKRVVITIPGRLYIRQAEKFMKLKRKWLLKTLSQLETKKSIIENTRSNYLKYKEQARSLVDDRLPYYNRLYKFNVNRVAIRNQQTRWGSCSSKSNLNFNYRLVFLPTELVDYIIVHELCHLQEMNHSESFWKLVEQTFPEHKKLRKKLKKFSLV